MDKSKVFVLDRLLILVIGATGNQGGAVTRKLIQNGHRVRAFTRNPDSLKANALKKLGVEIAKGDFNDYSTLKTAMKEVDAVFAMGSPFEQGVEMETKNGISIVDAVKNIGIRHLIYSSVEGADKNTGIPHFESKFKVEEYIKKQNVPFTIIRPVYFIENLLAPWTLPNLKEGRLASPMPPDRKLQMISLNDIASFVVYIIERREEFLGKRVDIASEEISGKELAERLSNNLDYEIKYIELTYDDVSAMGEDYISMYKWLNEIGYDVDISALRSNYPSIGWHTFDAWIKEHDWNNLLKPISHSSV